MTKYGQVSKRNQKYFKHLRRDFDVNDRVRVVANNPFTGREGMVVMVDDDSIYVDFEDGEPATSFSVSGLEKVDG